jgi:hypothetical protein
MKSLRANHTARSLLALQAPHMSRLDPGQTISAVANDMPSPMFAFSHGLRRIIVDRCEGAPVRKRHAELLSQPRHAGMGGGIMRTCADGMDR